MGDYDHAIACGQRALAMTAASGDSVHHAMVLGYLGTVSFSMGNYQQAMDLLRQALTSFEGKVRHERFGIMMLPSVRVLTWLVDCMSEVGDFGEGIACGEEALRIADATGHQGTKIITQRKLSDLALRQGNLRRAIPVLEHTLAQCHAAHVPLFVPGITASLGLAYALSGRSAEALPLLDQVQIREETLAATGGNPTVLRLGEAYLRVGRLHDAFRLAERARKLSHGWKERGNLAWARWLLAELAMHREPVELQQAEVHYRQALGLAEELGMRPLVAHCRLGLGTLHAEVGSQEQAQGELSGALALYRALNMMYWLPQVETRLAQLSGIGAPTSGGD